MPCDWRMKRYAKFAKRRILSSVEQLSRCPTERNSVNNKNKNMTFCYTNIQGKDYFMKMKLTKKGNKSYYMTRKKSADCLNEVPEGYEIFEKYDSGTVYIRKKKEMDFLARDVKIIEKELKKNKLLSDYKLDIHGDLIKIYVVEGGISSASPKSLSRLFGGNTFSLFSQFEERMRIHKKGDEYTLERYCYRGSIDDWIEIDFGADLEEIVKSNLRHLGSESYFDLM